MKGRLLERVLMPPVMLACCLLISGVPAVAQSENLNTFNQSPERCSNRTLSATTDLRSKAPSSTRTCRSVAWLYSTMMAGVTLRRWITSSTADTRRTQEWTPGTGTYTVNPDCTGSAVIISPSSALPALPALHPRSTYIL